MRGRGPMSKAGLRRALSEAGIKLNPRTLAAYLAKPPPARYTGLSPEIDAPPIAPAPAPSTADLEGAVAAAVETDDVAAMAAHVTEVRTMLGMWAERAKVDPAGARTYSTLARLLGDLRARLAEIRPRPEVERERLEALGEQARAELVERVEKSALEREDLHGKLNRAIKLLNEAGD